MRGIEEFSAWIAGTTGLGAAFFLLWRSEPSWYIPVFAAVITSGALGVVAGAYIDTRRACRLGRVLLWLSALVQALAAFASALSEPLVGVAFLTLTTAFLGTFRQSATKAISPTDSQQADAEREVARLWAEQNSRVSDPDSGRRL